jgi:hypothetical protein
MKYNLVARWPGTDLCYRDKQCPKCKKEYLDTDKIFCDICECTKEETIEEAMQISLKDKFSGWTVSPVFDGNELEDAWMRGANWQKEQDLTLIKEGVICLKESNILLEAMSNKIDKMYTEEEVYNIAFLLWEGYIHETKEYPDYCTWFEQNKKK